MSHCMDCSVPISPHLESLSPDMMDGCKISDGWMKSQSSVMIGCLWQTAGNALRPRPFIANPSLAPQQESRFRSRPLFRVLPVSAMYYRP